MSRPAATPAGLEVRPLIADRWTDLVELFGPNGASSGCWCMWFRVAPKTWSANGNAGNRSAMRKIVAGGDVPGLLAYEGDRPVGWVSVAPRSAFARIAGSGASASSADEGVWSVVCFFIRAGERGRGVGSALLAAAVDFARERGANALEAYPTERERSSNAEAYTGPRSMFERAGFREVGRFDRWAAVPLASGPAAKRLVNPPGRPVMRLSL